VAISGSNPEATTVSNQPGELTVLKAVSGAPDGTTGSLGVDASVVMDAESLFEPEYDWATTGSLTLNANSQMVLNRTIRVNALTIGGVTLAAGSYSHAYLAGKYAAFFTAAGSGRIIVGGSNVEPSARPAPATPSILRPAAR
jgi:hypothetical protein